MIRTLQYIQTPWGYFELEAHSDLEVKIMEDLSWQEGLFYGKPRYGHPEGKIINHIHEVLDNVENLRFRVSLETYEKLRLITLIHDTFKHKVNESIAKVGKNHHAFIAREFAEQYIADNSVLEVIELHDEAYHAWRKLRHEQNHTKAENKLQELLLRLGEHLELFYLFFVCDTQTGDKTQDPLRWFESKTGMNRVDVREF